MRCSSGMRAAVTRPRNASVTCRFAGGTGRAAGSPHRLGRRPARARDAAPHRARARRTAAASARAARAAHGWPPDGRPSGRTGRSSRRMSRSACCTERLRTCAGPRSKNCSSAMMSMAVPCARRSAEPDRADGLLGAATVGSGDAADRQRHVGAGDPQRPFGHLAHGLLADGAESSERAAGDPEVAHLGGVGVGHEAALEPLGAAGDIGERLGDPAAGAGLGRDDAAARRRAACGRRAPRAHTVPDRSPCRQRLPQRQPARKQRPRHTRPSSCGSLRAPMNDARPQAHADDAAVPAHQEPVSRTSCCSTAWGISTSSSTRTRAARPRCSTSPSPRAANPPASHPDGGRARARRRQLSRAAGAQGRERRHLRAARRSRHAKGPIERQVVRVVTPGTVTDAALLEERARHPGRRAGARRRALRPRLAGSRRGRFTVLEAEGRGALGAELERLQARGAAARRRAARGGPAALRHGACAAAPPWHFELASASRLLTDQLGTLRPQGLWRR